jgi:hypothetical protein
MKQFCENQITCKENYDADGNQTSWTCAAHLAEARAPDCHYKSEQERINAEHIPYAYPCADFKPINNDELNKK